jgi:predicted nucleic acid-binding protein
MSDKSLVDTNILVYAHDRSGGRKHQIAKALIEQLWMSGGAVVSAQVLQELCANLRRNSLPPLSTEETRRLVQDYLSWEVVVNTPDSALQALDLESRYKISFWDALIVHAAKAAGAMTLYSEDLARQQKFGSVRIVNPLEA